MDPFIEKLDNEDMAKKDLLDAYLDNLVNTSNVNSQTTLTYLIVKNNTTFTDLQYKYMLGLHLDVNGNRIYNKIVDTIYIHAQQLFDFFQFPSLLDFPLTDLKDICFLIGLAFKDIFFVPTKVTVFEHPALTAVGHSPALSAVIRYISRFNEQWIVTLLLQRHYLLIASPSP